MAEEYDFKDYSSRISAALAATNPESIEKVIEAILECSSSNGTIWLIGNGGSASTSSHFATDLSRCINANGKPVKGVSLCDNSGLITAIGNDFGFEEIFVNQLTNLAMNNDLLISISASGNSTNLIKAINYAKSKLIKTVALTGFNGGVLHKICDYSVHVPTGLGDYGVSEDSHSIISHYICSQIRG
jgi:D-sedoheptulose 7-phosphate isomerase